MMKIKIILSKCHLLKHSKTQNYLILMMLKENQCIRHTADFFKHWLKHMILKTEITQINSNQKDLSHHEKELFQQQKEEQMEKEKHFHHIFLHMFLELAEIMNVLGHLSNILVKSILDGSQQEIGKEWQ